jgi:thiol-disulfide isomerase/thioredoxin
MLAAQIATLLLAVTGFTGSPDVVMLEFHAGWCGPCRSMEPVVHQLVAAGYPIREVNIDQDRALAARYHVDQIPCFVMIVGGREVTRTVGANSPATLLAMFRQAGFDPSGGAIASSPPPRRFGGRAAAAGAANTASNSPANDPLAGALSLTPTPLTEPMPVATDPTGAAGQVANASAAGTAWGHTHEPTFCTVPPLNPSTTTATVDASPKPRAAEPPTLKARMLAACVRLKVSDSAGNSYGSGTIIDARSGEALILTCGHVFRDSDGKGPVMVDVFGPNGPQQVTGRLIACDLERDVGLVSISTSIALTAAPLAPLGTKPQAGDRVTGMGCSGGAAPTAEESHINSIGRFRGPPNLQVAGQPVQGRSGGGLFDAQGRVIGVCNAADPEDNEGLFAAQESIYKELDRAGLSFVYRSGAPAATIAAAHDTSAPPLMSGKMPSPTPPASIPAQLRPVASGSVAQLTAEEIATLAELREKAKDAEVICIVRPLSDPHAKSEIIVLDKASPAFLKQLGVERIEEPAARLTSLAVPDASAGH